MRAVVEVEFLHSPNSPCAVLAFPSLAKATETLRYLSTRGLMWWLGERRVILKTTLTVRNLEAY